MRSDWGGVGVSKWTLMVTTSRERYPVLSPFTVSVTVFTDDFRQTNKTPGFTLRNPCRDMNADSWHQIWAQIQAGLLAGCPWLGGGIAVPPLAGLVSGSRELWWLMSA